MPFDYTSGNPDNLVGGGPARMQDIQGPFYDIRAWLNSATGGGGASGSAVPVLSAAPVLDVGLLNQRRAGRQLTAADFTNLGLSVPLGLWNLTDLSDVSGNARALLNKGAVPFGTGINGVAGTAAVFSGSVGQALYIADTGAADPFRIKTGSWGCWVRTAKRGTAQNLFTKVGAAAGQVGYYTQVGAANVVVVGASVDGTNATNATGASDLGDDHWHWVVATFDGTTVRAYVDGVLEATANLIGALFASSGPLNIGASAADGATAANSPHFGRVDEAFVTADVLTEDEVRCLYAAKLTHTLTTVPTGVRINVHRKRRGAPLVVADFTTQPLRLHNFTAGALTDEGSGGQALVNNGAAVAVGGADGTPTSAFGFAGAQSLSATDAGLPAGTTSRSYGCWFKTASAIAMNFMAWGTAGTGDSRLAVGVAIGGAISGVSAADTMTGPFVLDGQWHHAVVVEDNAAVDGVRRKLYLDGRLVAGSTVLNAIVLAGANSFRVGANSAGGGPLTGQVDCAFVCGYAMSTDDIMRLYAKGAQDLGASPKNAGDHIERMDTSSLLLIGDTLDSQYTIDVGVMA